MSTTKRVIIGIIIIAVVAAGILAVESIRRGGFLYRTLRGGSETFTGECVPVYAGKNLLAGFCKENAAALAKKSFIDKSEGKKQEGWLLADVLLLSVKKEEMKPGTLVRVESTGRGKKAVLAWRDIADEANLVLLAPTKQGTLKLAAAMKGLDSRAQWVQDVDRIEIIRP